MGNSSRLSPAPAIYFDPCDVENCDHNVEEMWRRLDQKYGTKQKLIDDIISDIKRLPQWNIHNRYWE